MLCKAVAGVAKEEPGCGEDQTLFEGSCWWEGGNFETWYMAEEMCKGRGMTLASIHSQQEQDFVSRKFNFTLSY